MTYFQTPASESNALTYADKTQHKLKIRMWDLKLYVLLFVYHLYTKNPTKWRIYALNRLTMTRRHIAPRRPGIKLSGPADFLFGIGDHFVPMGYPTYGSAHREHRREHIGGNA